MTTGCGTISRGNPRLTTREAAGLFGTGVIGGLALVLLGSGAVVAAHAEDVDIFGFLRGFGQAAPPAAAPYDPYPARPVRLQRHRREAKDTPRSRRRHVAVAAKPQVAERGRPRASERARPQIAERGRPKQAPPPRNYYAALPPLVVPTNRTSTSPDLSGEVDASFAAGENAAYQQAVAGQFGYGWLYGRQTMCVRLCDGYAFPVGRLDSSRDLPLHQTACNAACPGAATALFTVAPGQTAVAEARGLSGQPYGNLRSAFAYNRKRVPNCSCHGDGMVATLPLPFEQDRTLRSGDIIVGVKSAYVLQGGRTPQFVSIRQDRSLSPALRQKLELATGSAPSVRVRLSGTPERAASVAMNATGVGADGRGSRQRVVAPAPF